MNPFLPQDQSPRLGFWAAWFSELLLQGQLLGQVPLKAAVTWHLSFKVVFKLNLGEREVSFHFGKGAGGLWR